MRFLFVWVLYWDSSRVRASYIGLLAHADIGLQYAIWDMVATVERLLIWRSPHVHIEKVRPWSLPQPLRFNGGHIDVAVRQHFSPPLP